MTNIITFDTISVSLLPLSVSEACLSFLMAGLVVILQPYKKTAHNVIDFLLLFYMTVIGASSFTFISFWVNCLCFIHTCHSNLHLSHLSSFKVLLLL